MKPTKPEQGRCHHCGKVGDVRYTDARPYCADGSCVKGTLKLAVDILHHAVPETQEVDYYDFDPGIRDIVRMLRQAGFNTTDSGDGVSKPPEHYATGCAMPVPNVAAMTTRATMFDDADRMAASLMAIHPDWHVEASYSTENNSYVLLAVQQNEKAAFLSLVGPIERPAVPVQDALTTLPRSVVRSFIRKSDKLQVFVSLAECICDHQDSDADGICRWCNRAVLTTQELEAALRRAAGEQP